MREIRQVFVDENLLAVGKALSHLGDVVYPGHHDCAQIPLGTKDEVWLPIVGAKGLDRFVITRDNKIRKKAPELLRYQEHGVRALFLTGKKDLNPREYVYLILHQWTKIDAKATQLGDGPWALSLTSGSGPIEIELPTPP